MQISIWPIARQSERKAGGRLPRMPLAGPFAPHALSGVRPG